MNKLFPQHLEILAQKIHDRWMKRRLEEGWTYGKVRNDELKQHSCLVPYEQLPENEKEYDRATALETLKSLVDLGYTVAKKEE